MWHTHTDRQTQPFIVRDLFFLFLDWRDVQKGKDGLRNLSPKHIRWRRKQTIPITYSCKRINWGIALVHWWIMITKLADPCCHTSAGFHQNLYYANALCIQVAWTTPDWRLRIRNTPTDRGRRAWFWWTWLTWRSSWSPWPCSSSTRTRPTTAPSSASVSPSASTWSSAFCPATPGGINVDLFLEAQM